MTNIWAAAIGLAACSLCVDVSTHVYNNQTRVFMDEFIDDWVGFDAVECYIDMREVAKGNWRL